MTVLAPTPRERIIAAATARTGLFEYLGRDQIATRCWLCGEPLGVTFKHASEAQTARLLGVELRCVGGCTEANLEATMPGGGAA